jgi:hypothetical protein
VIILYRRATGAIIGFDARSAVFVDAWLSDNAEIAAETGYIEYDEELNPPAAELIRDGPLGRYYVEDGQLYEDSEWEGPDA